MPDFYFFEVPKHYLSRDALKTMKCQKQITMFKSQNIYSLTLENV